MRTLLTTLIFCCLSITSYGQRNQKLETNAHISLYGALGYPYQSAGISIPIGSTGWNFQGHANTDLGGIVTQLGFPDNQFFGATKTLEINPTLSMNVGAGINTRLHAFSTGFSFAPLLQLQYTVMPWMSIGATYTQPTRSGEEWKSLAPVVQASGLIHLQWHKRSRGLVSRKRNSSLHFLAQGTTGILYTTASLEYSLYKRNGLAFRGQVFTDLGNLFASESLPDVQWLGAVYRYSLGEITLKTGAGMAMKAHTFKANSSPYFFIGAQQYLMSKTYLVLELWQPTKHNFSQRTAPFVQFGLAIALL